MINAEIVCDSINEDGNRLTSFVVTYPRFIMAEINTHRMCSKSSASSRAIPVSKMIDRMLAGPAKPVSWGKNQQGMQAGEELDEEEKLLAEGVWYDAMHAAVKHARKLLEIGVHKQVANRLLEPFCYATTLVTATEWANFFNLRAHKDAQPEFQALAHKMLEAYHNSRPKFLKPGQWHLPFSDQYIDEVLNLRDRIKITTARAARVSYMNFDGQIAYEKDFALHDSLIANKHMSPAEHPAMCMKENIFYANLRGFKSYRKFLPNENQTTLDIEKLLSERDVRHAAKENRLGKVA